MRKAQLLQTISAPKLVYLTRGIQDFLFPCIEWMTLGTHLYMQLITAICGTGCKGVTATADDLNLVILGMNTSLHWADLNYCVSVAYLHIGGYTSSNR
jgi:hypothetical protein